jgi:DNA (cytosine-5)-methyltransferase 1
VPYDLFQVTAPINRQNRDEHSPCHTLDRDNAAHAAVVQPVVGFYPTEGRDFKGFNDVCPTLKVGSGGTSGNPPGVAQSMSVRRLTPEECERLQGFPDGWTQVAWKGKAASECPDGPRYKALGNSMACNVMRWIGTRIAMVDALEG